MNRIKRTIRRIGLRRSQLAALRMRGERAIIAHLGSPAQRPRGRILCYHSVGTPLWGVNDVSPARFRRHLELALEAGFRFVPATEIARTGGRPNELALTFDDGVASVATNAAPILASLGIPWTLFVVSDWAEGHHAFGDGVLLNWRDIERAAARGAEIGSHSVSHPNFAHVDRSRVRHELFESRRAIAARTGIDARTFALPFGQYNDWRVDYGSIARQAGYQLLFAQSEDRRVSDLVPRTFITRFDGDRIFRAALGGAFDGWEEWV